MGTSMNSRFIGEVKFYRASPTFRKFCVVKPGIEHVSVYSKFCIHPESLPKTKESR